MDRKLSAKEYIFLSSMLFGLFFGARQHGLPGLKIADIGCDTQLLKEAQQAAEALLERDPELASCPAAAERLAELFTQAADTLN